MQARVCAILQGQQVNRLPFICRLDFWHRGLAYQGRLPPGYEDLSLAEAHQKVGLGQEEWFFPVALKLRQVEMILWFNGQELLHETDPEVPNFPTLWGMIPTDRPGTTDIEMITPVGKLKFQQRLLPQSLTSGASRPLMTIHPLRCLDDFRTYEFILEHSQFIPRYEAYFQRQAQLGEFGYLVPMLNRLPFQGLLLDALGEIPFFFALHDQPAEMARLLALLDEQMVDCLNRLADFQVPYVEFCDNIEVSMTNPRLFSQRLLPAYQRYASILHAQDKKMGSHTDGNLKGLLPLLAECGLDVCESFTPAPLTACSFEEAWEAWENGPLIWGGLPSILLEDWISETLLHQRVEAMLNLIGNRPIILGVSDAVMPNNLIERVSWIADAIERHVKS